MSTTTPRHDARRATLRALGEATIAQIREVGAVNLSLRGVARAVGMSPAGLYRYVDGRDGLLTLAIEQGFDDLADHLLAATCRDEEVLGEQVPSVPRRAGPDEDVAERLRAGALAYRWWGVSRPNTFGLVFGDPIPGYAAPPDGPTVRAFRRVGDAFGRPYLEAYAAGRLTPPELPDSPDLVTRLQPMVAQAEEALAALAGDAEVPPQVALGLLLGWGRLHGTVSLEVFGAHHWLFPDGAEALYVAEVEAFLHDAGVVERPR